MFLGAVLSSHDRCVTYSASKLMMVLYSHYGDEVLGKDEDDLTESDNK